MTFLKILGFVVLWMTTSAIMIRVLDLLFDAISNTNNQNNKDNRNNRNKNL